MRGAVAPGQPGHLAGLLPVPFALPGLVLAIVGSSGHRRGKPLAVVGAILSVIALILGAIMFAGNAR